MKIKIKMLFLFLILLLICMDITNCQNCNADFQNRMLQLHNRARRRHKAPPLRLNSKLTNFAQSYATQLKNRNGGLVHSNIKGMGENLAALFGNGSPTKCGGNYFFGEYLAIMCV